MTGSAQGAAATTACRICSRCVMDSSDPDIVFDESGVCNHCRRFEDFSRTLPPPDERARTLSRIVEEIKAWGRGRDYDCILGLSGGVDSSFVALKAKEFGLRPLVVHFDSGWNSEIAVRNIENIVKRLGFDLYTHVVDWEEMKDLQVAYLKASVVNADIPQDYAFLTLLFRLAVEKGIRYFLTGYNFQTEFAMPKKWYYHAHDVVNLRAIHRRFGRLQLRNYPLLNPFVYLYYSQLRIRKVDVLYYLDYDKARAMKTLEAELGWRYYGGKHYESIWTRFYQGFYLPSKFGIDKRKAHLSSLVMSGQMTRARALEELREDPYPAGLLAADREFVIKKLSLTEEEFREILARPIVEHSSYGTDWYVQAVVSVGRRIRTLLGTR